MIAIISGQVVHRTLLGCASSAILETGTMGAAIETHLSLLAEELRLMTRLSAATVTLVDAFRKA